MSSSNLLKKMIIEKYSQEKFLTGVLLVMQWLNATTGKHVTYKEIDKKACSNKTPSFTRPQKEALRKLFGKALDP